MKYLASFLIVTLAACSSVELPVERYYRLEPSAALAPDPIRAGILRVHDLQLGTALDSDRLLLQAGVRLEPRALARWVAPLDRLVTDAMVLGLSRARVCDLVKGSADAGPQTWSLHGRIVAFVEAVSDGGSQARVTLELWLERGDQLLFHDEFSCVEPLAESGSDQAVVALSRGLNQIVGRVVGRMRDMQLFAAAHAKKAARDVAGPSR